MLMNNNTEFTDVRVLAEEFMMHEIGKFELICLFTQSYLGVRLRLHSGSNK